MNRNLRDALDHWLEGESSGRDVDAEHGLFEVFRALPVPTPSPDLALRTLSRLGLAGQRSAAPHWVLRWAIACALAVSGLTMALLAPALASALSLKSGINWIVDLGAGILTTLSSRLATGFTFWEVIAGAGATAADFMATPQTLGLMLATLLFATATFRVLAGLVPVERSSFHA